MPTASLQVPNPQIPQPFPLNERTLTVTPAINGMFGECGSGGPQSSGWWTFHWVPDNSFVGSIVVMGRIAGQEATTDGVPQVAIPYLALYLNGVIVTPTVSSGGIWTTATITGNTLFQIPTSALNVGLVFNCDSGFGRLYTSSAISG